MLKKLTAITCAVFFISGCSTASKNITAASVSPLQYANFECNQLQAEGMRLNGKISQLGGRLDEAASNDQAIMGVGMILFWPALFALGGTKDQEAEYAKVKGEYDALQQASIQKSCNLTPTPVIEASTKPSEATTTTTTASNQKLLVFD